MKELKIKQAPIIAITSIGENTISKLDDCHLKISTKNESIHYILDLTYSCIL